MNATLLSFAIALSVLLLAAGECADPSGAVHSQVVNRTHRLITLCWVDRTTAIYSSKVNVRCQRGEETMVAVSDGRDQEVEILLECGYCCNASVYTVTYNGRSYNRLLPSFNTTDTLTPIVKSTAVTPNGTISVTIELAGGVPLSCGAPQTVGLKWQQMERVTVYSNWTWDNGNAVLSLWDITCCDLPLNVSAYYTPYSSTNVYSSEEPHTILPKPLDAPNITSVLAQDSALTVVFSDKAVCRNSSWEVCVAVDSQDQTEHCSHQSAEDRLITVEAGNGKSGRARVLFGDRISQYSETFLIPTSVLPKDQLTLNDIGLPDVQLCYEVNLPTTMKVTILPEPKHFAVHYKLCDSMDERISNLSVNGNCTDLHGWLGGHCYEVQLFLTLDIDGLEISLNTTAVRKGLLLPLISLAAIPGFLIVLGCILCAVWAKRGSVRNSSKTDNSPLEIKDPETPVLKRFWLAEIIEPENQTDIFTIGSEFGQSDDEDQGKLGSYLGEFDSIEPHDEKCACQVTGSDYIQLPAIVSPSTGELTNSGMSGLSIMRYSKEPSLLNFSSGE